MGNITTIEDYTKYDVLNENDSHKLRIICRILAIICNIPCFLSIFVFLLQDTKLKLGQKIQLRLCITIVLYEASHYFPVSKDYQWLCYFQCIISFGIQVIISYLAMIYTYIALIMFIKPNIINSKFNKFFINISPGLFFIGIIFYILYVPKLFIYFHFTVYPDDEDKSRLLNYCLIFIFFIINIFNNILLVYKIRSFIKKLSNIDYYAKEKLCFFIKKLVFNILGMIFVFHFILPVGILVSLKRVEGSYFFNFESILYLYINKAILGIVFWLIYIYNRNLWHKFLILIKIEKKEKYQEKFEEEEKMIEFCIDGSTSASDETKYINMEELDNISSLTYNPNIIKPSLVDEDL